MIITSNHPELAEKFSHLTWFKNTDQNLQDQILNLPTDFRGFLEDLASRPDEIGELEVLRLTQISFGRFLVLVVFEVRSSLTNQVFTYEYASWKTGSRPGAKGIIFLEEKGQITHFLVSKAHSFSTTTENLEALGGLYLHPFENKLENLPKKIEEEICFHLGVDHLVFKKVIDLGMAHPDLGMTNNTSHLFAATVDISDTPIEVKDSYRTTHKPVGFELKVVPISEFRQYLQEVNDNFFLSVALRAMLNKDLNLDI